MLLEINQGNFESEVLQSQLPVLTDLWAPWCGPCKALAPILEKVAEHYGEKLKIVKINIDENPAIATKYGIMSIPTLLLFADGEVKEQLVGLVAKDKIVKKIDKHIG
jgi:thioredoxin 1